MTTLKNLFKAIFYMVNGMMWLLSLVSTALLVGMVWVLNDTPRAVAKTFKTARKASEDERKTTDDDVIVKGFAG